MTEPSQSKHQHDARDGDGDPRHDPAALGEQQARTPDGDGGATPAGQDAAQPGAQAAGG